MKDKYYYFICLVVAGLILVGIFVTPRDTNKYSNAECMEDYRYFTQELNNYPEGSDSWCEIKYVIDNGFFIDKDSVIHERPNFIEVIEASKDLY